MGIGTCAAPWLLAALLGAGAPGAKEDIALADSQIRQMCWERCHGEVAICYARCDNGADRAGCRQTCVNQYQACRMGCGYARRDATLKPAPAGA